MTRIPPKLQPWFEARRRYRLSHVHIQMARELGLNPPRKFVSLANARQEPWKRPLPEFIAECYRKRFGRSALEQVRSLEEVVQAEERRLQEKRARRAEKTLTQANRLQTSDVQSGISPSAEGTP
jgi:hypothetical protein